jgi:hypothetical protein
VQNPCVRIFVQAVSLAQSSRCEEFAYSLCNDIRGMILILRGGLPIGDAKR